MSPITGLAVSEEAAVSVGKGRLVRFTGAVVLACASIPVVGVGVAAADTLAITPSNSGYFYSAGIDKPDASPAAPPNVTATVADGVSAGNLAVAAQGGQEDKVSFLYFDVFNLPPDATVDKAVVTMKLVPTSPPNDISYNESPDLVAACKAGSSGFAGDDGVGIANAPERLCKDFSAKAKAGPAGTYQWDVTSLAQGWLSGDNDGIAFTTASTDPGTNFQVVFGPASSAKLDVSYTAAVPVTDPVPAAPDVPTDLTPVAPGGGFVPGPGGLGGTTDPGPLTPQPTANEPPAPVTPTGGTTTTNALPVALSTSMRPTNGFWLAVVGVAGALVLVSLVLGDTSGTTARRRRTRLSVALADPQRVTALQTIRHRPA